MSLYSVFSTNPEDEKRGVEFSYTDSFGNIMFSVRLARAGGANKKFEQLHEKAMAPYRRVKKLDSSVTEAVYRKVFAEACALPGTWKFREVEGMTCEGNTCVKGEDGKLSWTPNTPKARMEDGFIKGIQVRSGEVVKDTVDNVYEVFQDLPELFLMLFQEAASRDAFRYEEREEDSKNS